jgi:hypothetical protein
MTRSGKVVLYFFIVSAGFIGCCFVFRTYLLQIAFKKVQAHVHDRYNASLHVSSIRFSSLSRVELNDVVLIPDGADTFVHIREVAIHISLMSLICAKVSPDDININDASFTIYNEGSRNNISFLRSSRDRATDDHTTGSFRERAENWKAKLFQLLKTAFTARDISIRYEDTTAVRSIFIPSFFFDQHILSGTVIDKINADTLSVDGMVIKTEEAYRCTIRHTSSDTVYLPFLDHERGLKCRFHTIDAGLRFGHSSGIATVSADVMLDDFHIYHWRLAREDVILPHAQFKGTFTFTDGAVELDSSSTFNPGYAPCHLFARYSVKPDTTFTLGIHMPEVAADSFFQSLPVGMFNTLKGISASGTLAYDLDFAIHTDDPDSLLFYSAMKQKNLHIRHYGADDYARINSTFTYDAYDKDRLVRRLTVGRDNPYFTPLNLMSPFLAQSVLQAEDPSFMQHRGFYMDAFRESIAKNYKEHRFARGGSTISMQLVKNVFLSHDKTVSRKAEEALIVYLIENLGLVSKERMLEVYLNVIEWGPNVYGIGEAAHFYFDKKPQQLTLQESLFLASIIPRPKSFQYEFDGSGQLRPSMGSYFKTLTTRMVWRGVLDPSDTIGLRPIVSLKGPALHVVSPRDSIAVENETNDD